MVGRENVMHDYADGLAGGLAAVDGDLEREFETRLVESSTLAFRVAFGVLRRREDAEEVAQEAFLKAYRDFRQLRDRDRFRAWLVRMTWRLAIDRQRSDRRRALREQDHATSESSTAGGDRTAALWEAIDTLPDKLRMAIVLANIEGYDIPQVARLLKVPPGTVKSRLFLARQRLKELLQ